jgi:DNA repair protein RadC
MTDKGYIKFLESYFSLFEAIINTCSFVNDSIIGSVRWLEETDIQEFKWEKVISEKDALNLSGIISLIKSNNYNLNDKIIIPEEQLLEELLKSKWGKEEAKALINLLLDIEVKMIDDGEETDSFFLHF